MVEIIREHLVRISSKCTSVKFVQKGLWNKNYYVRDGHFTDESAFLSLLLLYQFCYLINMKQLRKNKLEFSVMISRAFLLLVGLSR